MQTALCLAAAHALVRLEDGTVVGGEDPVLAQDYLFGGGEVYYGSSATQGTLVAPSATIASWNSFLAAANAMATPSAVWTSEPPSLITEG